MTAVGKRGLPSEQQEQPAVLGRWVAAGHNKVSRCSVLTSKGHRPPVLKQKEQGRAGDDGHMWPADQ